MLLVKALTLWWKRERKNAKLHQFKKQWRKRNPHNNTSPAVQCDLDRVSIGRFTYGVINMIHHGAENYFLSIGDFCSVASGVEFLVDGEHDVSGLMTFPVDAVFNGGPSSRSKGHISIGHDVWVGRDAKVMSGVSIGNGAVIAADAVVVADVPPYAIVGGVPAKVIRFRFDENMRNRLSALNYEDIDEAFISENKVLFSAPLSSETLERMPGLSDE